MVVLSVGMRNNINIGGFVMILVLINYCCNFNKDIFESLDE